MRCRKCNNRLEPNWEFCSRCLEPTGFLILEKKVIEGENEYKIKKNELIYIVISVLSYLGAILNDDISQYAFYILFLFTLIVGKLKYKNNFLLKFMFWGYIIFLIIKIIIIVIVIIGIFSLFKGLIKY